MIFKIITPIAFLSILLGIGIYGLDLKPDTQTNPFLLKRFSFQEDIKKGDVVLLHFINPGECVKCDFSFMATYSWMQRFYSQTKHKIFLVGYIRCNRMIEFDLLKQNYTIYDFLLKNDGKILDSLELPIDTRIALINYQGYIMGHVNTNDFAKNLQASIKKILNDNGIVPD